MNKETELPPSVDQLLPCPFCGHEPPADLSDTLYPSGTYRRYEAKHGGFYHYVSMNKSKAGDTPCWCMNCTLSGGGCGAHIRADSREQAIASWNRRATAAVLAAQPQPHSEHPPVSPTVSAFGGSRSEGSEHAALIGRLKSLRVVLGLDSPETRGWAPAVQQEARRVMDAAIASLLGSDVQEVTAQSAPRASEGGTK